MALIPAWHPGCCAHLRFTGSKICHCAACHETFVSPNAFDMHKLMDGCREPSACGLVKRDQVWHWPPKDSLVRWLAKV